MPGSASRRSARNSPAASTRASITSATYAPVRTRTLKDRPRGDRPRDRPFRLPANLKLSVVPAATSSRSTRSSAAPSPVPARDCTSRPPAPPGWRRVTRPSRSRRRGPRARRPVYATALEHVDELCAPYATVIDIDRSRLPSAEVDPKLGRAPPGRRLAAHPEPPRLQPPPPPTPPRRLQARGETGARLPRPARGERAGGRAERDREPVRPPSAPPVRRLTFRSGSPRSFARRAGPDLASVHARPAARPRSTRRAFLRTACAAPRDRRRPPAPRRLRRPAEIAAVTVSVGARTASSPGPRRPSPPGCASPPPNSKPPGWDGSACANRALRGDRPGARSRSRYWPQ